MSANLFTFELDSVAHVLTDLRGERDYPHMGIPMYLHTKLLFAPPYEAVATALCGLTLSMIIDETPFEFRTAEPTCTACRAKKFGDVRHIWGKKPVQR